jgi:hypothetical protein
MTIRFDRIDCSLCLMLDADLVVSDPRSLSYVMPLTPANRFSMPRRTESSPPSLYSMHGDAIIQDVLEGW